MSNRDLCTPSVQFFFLSICLPISNFECDDLDEGRKKTTTTMQIEMWQSINYFRISAFSMDDYFYYIYFFFLVRIAVAAVATAVATAAAAPSRLKYFTYKITLTHTVVSVPWIRCERFFFFSLCFASSFSGVTFFLLIFFGEQFTLKRTDKQRFQLTGHWFIDSMWKKQCGKLKFSGKMMTISILKRVLKSPLVAFKMAEVKKL